MGVLSNMDNAELDRILEDHKKWLENASMGSRANLGYANLGGADLEGANLRDANLKGVYLRDANLEGANLRDANLGDANLRDADLVGANLDFSSLPLGCGLLKVHMDDRQVIQLLYHVLSIVNYSNNVSEGLKESLLTVTNVRLANQFHRVEECGMLTTIERTDTVDG